MTKVFSKNCVFVCIFGIGYAKATLKLINYISQVVFFLGQHNLAPLVRQLLPLGIQEHLLLVKQLQLLGKHPLQIYLLIYLLAFLEVDQKDLVTHHLGLHQVLPLTHLLGPPPYLAQTLNRKELKHF